ncbi:MAG TPA: hypothetical protein VFP80_18930 [Thermoanaerobaculia bacterium]|nr:hypothetical protein [Thermoanaerobaculia bacterium]
MSEHHFDAEIMLSGRAAEADRETLRERVYATDAGTVRVRAEWSAPANGTPVIRVPLHVVDERADGDARDIPAFVELFFHDAFLLFNLAAPGSFGGTISVSGGAYRVQELTFDARTFEYASASLAALPLSDVAAWYDSVRNGTNQIATTAVTKALFHLLHLARGAEDDDMTVIRLAQSADALQVPVESLAALRETILRGTAPVLHPMADDALDPAVDDDSLDWSDVIDDAAGRVIGALQSKVRLTPPAPR